MDMSKQKKRRRKQRKRKQQRRKLQKTPAVVPAAAATAASLLPGEIWSSTYKRLVQWHQTQVQSLCRGVAFEEQQQSGTDEEAEAEEEQQPYVELDNIQVAMDADADQVDAEYLKFLEVTIKHQQERQRSRDAALVDSPPSQVESESVLPAASFV